MEAQRNCFHLTFSSGDQLVIVTSTEKNSTGPSALPSPKLRDPWEGDTSWLGHRQGAWDLAGSGRRWTESQAGPDPQLCGRGFRPGSKPHAWGSTEHVKAGRWERSPGFHEDPEQDVCRDLGLIPEPAGVRRAPAVGGPLLLD